MMIFKKILCFVFALFITAATSKAATNDNLSAMCAQPYDLSWKSTRFLTNVTGMTFLSQSIANSIIKKELKKSMGSKNFKVKMKSHSAKDLAEGRFKSLSITGKNLDLDGIYLTKFSADTICDFNYVKATKKTITFKENFAMNYSLTVSEDDLKKTVLSKDYMSFLKSLNLKFGSVNFLELENVDVKLKDDKFVYSLKMNNHMFNYKIPFSIDVSAKMKIQNGSIKATEVTWENGNQKINLSQITNILNLINPLNFTVNILGNEKTKVALKNLDIDNKHLIIDGTIFVPKNTQEAQK